jgi:hypothetical protein
MGEKVRAIVEDEIEHLALPVDGGDGFIFYIELCMEDVLFELWSRREANYLEREIVGELEAYGFDFGEFGHVVLSSDNC